MDLANVGSKFKGEFTTIGGKKFKGQILDIPDTSRVSNFLSPRRYLRVTSTCLVVAGDVVNTPEGKFIVAEHGSGFYQGKEIYTHHKLFAVDRVEELTSETVTRDPVTGLDKRASDTDGGTIYVSVQPKNDIEDKFKIQTPQHVLLVNKEVQVGDEIGDAWKVTKVDPVLGVYTCLVKEA